MSSEKHVIKKYANRKLYDTHTSRYITLEGISELVREGHDIRVVERETGRDLTGLILSQIVMGEEKRTNGVEKDRGQALLGYVRRTLSGPASLVGSEVERRVADFEELVDSAVERALQRLSIPTRRDLERIDARLARLEQQLHVGGAGVRSSRTGTASARR